MGTIEEEMIGVFAIGTTTTRRIWDYIYLSVVMVWTQSASSVCTYYSVWFYL